MYESKFSGGIWLQTSSISMAPEAGGFNTTPSFGFKSYFLDLVDILHVSALWFPQSSSFVAIARPCLCFQGCGLSGYTAELVADCIS